jgi:hypothetical protein
MQQLVRIVKQNLGISGMLKDSKCKTDTNHAKTKRERERDKGAKTKWSHVSDSLLLQMPQAIPCHRKYYEEFHQIQKHALNSSKSNKKPNRRPILPNPQPTSNWYHQLRFSFSTFQLKYVAKSYSCISVHSQQSPRVGFASASEFPHAEVHTIRLPSWPLIILAITCMPTSTAMQSFSPCCLQAVRCMTSFVHCVTRTANSTSYRTVICGLMLGDVAPLWISMKGQS